MSAVKLIIDEAQRMKSCVVSEPAGFPRLSEGIELPEDLKDFYRLCGGLDIFPCEDWGWRILSPSEFLRADSEILTTYYASNREKFDGTPSEFLYTIALRGEGPDCISIDLSTVRAGLCFDSFPDTHATDASRVVAVSFTELLSRLFFWRQDGYFWTDSHYGYFGQTYGQLEIHKENRRE